MKRFNVTYKLIAFGITTLLLLLNFSVSVNASGTETVVNWGGGRAYRLFVPSGYTPGDPLPLVVMLHGCAQTAVQFRDGTQMNQLAEQENFIVLYPEQSTSANMSRCWNWFEPDHQRRGSGEPQIIVDMVRQVQSNFTINEDAVFVSGLSAGGGMTVTLGVLYPDVFTAIAPAAGLAYQAGTSMLNAFQAMSPGTPAINPATAARNAFDQVPAHARRVIPALVIHGAADHTVRPAASEHIVTQMLAYNRFIDPTIQTTPTTTNGTTNGLAYTLRTFTNGTGENIIQHYVITGLGHAWPGGNGSIAHTDSRGLNASLASWRFFQSHMGIPTYPPHPTDPITTTPTEPPTTSPTEPYTPAPTEPTVPTEPVINYTTISANVNQHFLAGRLNMLQFNHYFLLHGPATPFNLYQIVGTTTWTSTNPRTGS
ncbi:MAG: PHB depolymerase family esterase [Defluviitaleaceae bacterium]|nr:PHB depolymerase family esterase [Defluviitaleaceae bacterium]